MWQSREFRESGLTFRALMAGLVLFLVFITVAAVQADANNNGKGKPEYYNMLREACSDNGCCLFSADHMEYYGYRLADGQCPASYPREGALACAASYRWCETGNE